MTVHTVNSQLKVSFTFLFILFILFYFIIFFIFPRRKCARVNFRSERFADSQANEPDFIGAPYEFWVGGNVPIGTSVGQVKINDALSKRNDLIYDLLHSYHEGGKSKKLHLRVTKK